MSNRSQSSSSCSMIIPCNWNFCDGSDSNLASSSKSSSDAGCMTRTAPLLFPNRSCFTPSGTVNSRKASLVPVPVKANEPSPSGLTKFQRESKIPSLKSSDSKTKPEGSSIIRLTVASLEKSPSLS